MSQGRELDPQPTVYPSKIALAVLLSRRWDLDPRLAVYKTATLPLSYFGKPILRDPAKLSKILANFASLCWDKTVALPLSYLGKFNVPNKTAAYLLSILAQN